MSQTATEGLAVAEEKWLTVAEAAAQVAVPLRTLHRWVKSGAVRCRADGKKRQVLLSEVQKHASERGPGATGVPASAGAVPARAPVARNLALVTDGDLAARVFGLLDEGLGPAEIVRQEHLAPAVVLGLSDQWTRLRATGKPGDVPVRDQVAGLRRKLDALDELVHRVVDVDLGVALGDLQGEASRLRSELGGAVLGLSQRLESLERQTASNERAWAELFASRGRGA